MIFSLLDPQYFSLNAKKGFFVKVHVFFLPAPSIERCFTQRAIPFALLVRTPQPATRNPQPAPRNPQPPTRIPHPIIVPDDNRSPNPSNK